MTRHQPRLVAMPPLALIGYRGTGKTTVAQSLALEIGWDWVDADVEIEQRAGKSIAAIFADDGEPAFRDLEVLIVAELCQREQTVVAMGGGAILRDENRLALQACLGVVWLRASADTLAERILGDPSTADRRPNLTNSGGRNEIKQVLAERTPIYATCATLEVDTEDKDPTEIAGEIAKQLTLRD